MRPVVRSLATLLAAVGVATCSDVLTAPARDPGATTGASRGAVSLEPVFSLAATAASSRLADFGISYDHVRVVLVRSAGDTAADTSIVFTPGVPDVTLDLSVALHTVDESFGASIDFTNAGAVVFHGGGTVQAHAADRPSSVAQSIAINYVGPGSSAARIAISPRATSIIPSTTQTFSVAAFDGTGAPVSAGPVLWTTSDPSVATISADATLHPTGKRGVVTITAMTPTDLTDTASATVSLPATGIRVTGGDGQTGRVATTLSAPVTVQVTAADGGGVSGTNVNFVAPTGGAVNPGSAITDANGTATTKLTLGTGAGPQSFGAATSEFVVAIQATATPGDAASITVSSGAGQSASVRGALAQPLVAKVVDAFGNVVPGATVSWSRVGSGTLSTASSTTGADGLATVAYSAGNVVGNETITAATAGVSATVSFGVKVLPALPTELVWNVEPSQFVAGSVMSPAPQVAFVDASGAVVDGTSTVTIALVGGAPGQTLSGTLTQTAVAGVATFPNLTLSGAGTGYRLSPNTAGLVTSDMSTAFNVVAATAGVPNKLGFKVDPSAVAAGTVMSPAIQVAVEDVGGATASGSTASVTLEIGNNAAGATLGGTLTRTAVAGVATFDNITFDKAGTGYTLVARSGTLLPVTSAAITVAQPSAASIAGLTLSTAPQTTDSNNVAFAVAPVVQLVDASSHAVALANIVVTMTAAPPSSGTPNTAPTLLVGTATTITATTDANGLATFSGVRAVGVAQDYRLEVSVTPAGQTYTHTSSDIHLLVGPANRLAATAGDNQVAYIGTPTPIGERVQLLDTLSQTTTYPTTNITFTAPTGGGSVGNAATNGNGFVDANWTLGSAEGSNTLLARATFGSTTRSVTFTATASDIHAMALVATPTTATNGTVLSPQPTIQLNDGTTSHNALHKSGVVITATVAPAAGSTGGVANNTATFTRSGTATATTDANGLASFSNLGILSTQGGLTGELSFAVTSGTTQTISPVTADVVVNAGAATTMQRSTSQVVNTPVGTALPSASNPAVRVLDTGGSQVANATGLSIVFSVISGACTTSSGTATTTDASGIAVIPNFTVPTSPAQSCQVRATSSLGGSPIDFDIVVGPVGGSVWLGATDDDFATASNWRGSIVPSSGANMFIPVSVPHAPNVTAATTVGALAIEAGASFNVSGNVLTINGATTGGTGSTFTVSGGAGAKAVFHGGSTTLGNLNVAARTVQFDNNATITGNLVATDTATILHTGSARVLTISGSLTSSSGTTLSGLSTVKFTGSTFPAYGNATTAGAPSVTQISANMSVPSGASSFVNNLTVSDAALSVNGNGTTLTVGASLDVKSSTGASGEILMNSGDPTLIVTGSATFEGKAQNGQGLTVGTLDLRGDFTQRNRTTGGHGEFEPGPLPFIVKFTGGGSAQSVFFDSPGTSPNTESWFTNVLVVNQGGVTQSSHAYINGGTMTVGGSPADAGSPAMWATGFSGNDLFITGGSSLQVLQSGSFTVTSGGALDLSGGSCSQYQAGLVTGNVIGGSCVVDASLTGSLDNLFRSTVVRFRH